MLQTPTKLIILGLGLIILASSWALWQPGFFKTHDPVHTARITQMTQALVDGHFPVRWVKDFGQGFGMPLFEFYAPLPYYVGSILYLTGLDIYLVLKILILIANLLTAIGSYRLGLILTKQPRLGLLTSAIITLAPYRAVDIYVRGALSETWAMMAMPWILVGILQFFKKSTLLNLPLAIGFTTLFLSHNLSTLMFMPFFLLFTCGCWLLKKNKNIKPLLSIGLSLLLAMGVSAFYLLPALLEQKYTIVWQQAVNSFPYAQYFVYLRQLVTPLWGFGGAAPGPYNDQSNFLGYGQLIALFITAIGGLWLVKEKKWRLLIKYLFSLILLGLSLLMLHGRSQFIWQAIPMLAILQFPWRWLTVAINMLGMAVAIGFAWWPKNILTTSFIALLVIITLISNWQFFQPQQILTEQQLASFYFTSPTQIKTQTSPGYLDYLPTTLIDQHPVAFIATTAAKTTIKVQQNLTHQKTIIINQNESAPVSLAIANFPGWQVTVDDRLTKSFANQQGWLSAQVPAGQHTVTAHFATTPIRKFSDYLSAISLLLLIILINKKSHLAQL